MHEDDKPLAIASFASFMCLAFFQPLLIYDGWNYGFDLGSWPLAACIYDATLIPIFLLCSLSCGSIYFAWILLVMSIISFLGFTVVMHSVPIAQITCCCSDTFCTLRDEYLSEDLCEVRREDYTCEEDEWRVALFWVGVFVTGVAQVLRLFLCWEYKLKLQEDREAVVEYLTRRKHAGSPGPLPAGFQTPEAKQVSPYEETKTTAGLTPSPVPLAIRDHNPASSWATVTLADEDD
uniref:Transmembrane protein n=2 Tax=Phaeomonas parva TaxID=124430 RepID=A0A7S1XU14_9STRA|mmetsp:Transcript_37299/g.116634  ORF Transcript_37299/g.116634 Transcript_37299/m.116634 type:complete len:235 (+) Transcript_37299:746-1450(+)